MNRRAVRAVLWLTLLGSAVLILWGLQGGPTRGEVPLTPPPSRSAVGTGIPPAPTQQATPAAPTTGAMETATEPATPSAAALPDLTGTPVHLQIRQGDEVLVSAPTDLTQLNSRNELYPEPQVIGWYGPPQWDTVPGNESAHPGVFAGHVTYGGVKDVFFRLGEVRAGDVVTVTYSDGVEATFIVDADALSAPKNDITEKADTDYAWVWSLAEPGRKVSIFTCDPSEGRDLAGHSFNNWVVQATRVA